MITREHLVREYDALHGQYVAALETIRQLEGAVLELQHEVKELKEIALYPFPLALKEMKFSIQSNTNEPTTIGNYFPIDYNVNRLD